MRAQTHFAAVFWLLAGLSAAACGCNSMSGHANNQAGLYSYQQGNYALAREQFRRALIDDPENPQFACNLANAMKKQGDWSSAEPAYAHVIALDPNHQPAYHGLAQLMVEQGRQAEAAKLITDWAMAQPRNAGAQIEMAWIQRGMGDTLGAERSLYRALAIRPDHPIATAHLGQLYQETGAPERAAAMYHRSLQADWFQPEVRSRLAALPAHTPFAADPTMFASNVPSFPTGGAPPVTTFVPDSGPTAFGQPVAPFRNDDPAHVPPMSMGPVPFERR